MIRYFAASIAGLCCGSAFAADMAAIELPPIPPAAGISAISTFSWTGIYAGIQAGWNMGSDDYVELERSTGSWLSSGDLDLEGFVGGAHVGYNWQWGRFLFGAEADIELNTADAHNVTDIDNEETTEMNWQASLRARMGTTLSERLLIYGTGGVAFAKIQRDYYHYDPSDGSLTHSDDYSATETGWTAGVGAEYAFSNRLTTRLEYRYSDFGETSIVAKPWVDAVATNATELHTLRVGVSYKF